MHLALYCFANSQLSTALNLLYRARYLMLLVFGEDHPEMALLDVSNLGEFLIPKKLPDSVLPLRGVERVLPSLVWRLSGARGGRSGSCCEPRSDPRAARLRPGRQNARLGLRARSEPPL